MLRNRNLIVRTTAAEQERWREALKKDGRTASEVCRAALERIAKRIEKKEGAEK